MTASGPKEIGRWAGVSAWLTDPNQRRGASLISALWAQTRTWLMDASAQTRDAVTQRSSRMSIRGRCEATIILTYPTSSDRAGLLELAFSRKIWNVTGRRGTPSPSA